MTCGGPSSVVTTAMPGPDNPIGSVQELSQSRGVAPPQYVLLDASGESHCPSFTIQVVWCDLKATGVGTSKVTSQENIQNCFRFYNIFIVYDQKEAKRLAAKHLLEQVSGEGGNSTSDNSCDNTDGDTETENVVDNAHDPEVKKYTGNQVGALQEYVLSKGLGDPVYTEKEATGPPHKRCFTLCCKVGEIESERSGNTKKEAKVRNNNTFIIMILNCVHFSTRLQGQCWSY